MNQSIAVLSQQMNSSLQLLAANGRLQTIETARREKAREASRARKKKMMNNFGKSTYKTPVLTHLP
jgi:conjugal transfer/entry exclusion protein